MTIKQQLRLNLAQLNHAKSQILGTLVTDADGTPLLDGQGQPRYEGGAQSFVIGDTTYFRVKFSDLTDEIQRVENKISAINAQMRPPKKRFLDFQYGL